MPETAPPLVFSEGAKEKLMSLPEVAAYLGVPLHTLYGWRSRSEGPRGIKVGRHVRVRRSDLESWLEEHADRERTPA